MFYVFIEPTSIGSGGFIARRLSFGYSYFITYEGVSHAHTFPTFDAADNAAKTMTGERYTIFKVA